jgi:hypothetical protein
MQSCSRAVMQSFSHAVLQTLRFRRGLISITVGELKISEAKPTDNYQLPTIN